MSTDTEWLQKAKYGYAKKMAIEHWSYVESLIRITNPDMPERYIDMMRFHYTTASAHFYGHGYEDAMDDVWMGYGRFNPDTPVMELIKELETFTGVKQ